MKEENAALFQTMKRIADGIAVAVGKNCEVVIHDFSDLDKSLIHIAGNLTNRKVGAPITDLAFKTYKDLGDKAENLFGYRTIANGRVMKSSTMFLRNNAEQVIGCLCVNLDITDLLNAKAALESFTHMEEGAAKTSERFASSFQETLESILEETVEEMSRQPGSMDKDERLEFVRRLNRRDVFVFKGAVNQVAKLFGVSRYTVYNYIKEVREAENSA
jgi:predicted transcriptional regulator YheO